MNKAAHWPVICPACRTALGPLAALGPKTVCRGCGEAYAFIDGMADFLPTDRAARYDGFLTDYTKIRLAEGRVGDASYYRGLPDCPADHALAGQWRIRRRTFACLIKRVLPRLNPGAAVLDLGAGVGWLSHRLAELGFAPCAVDLSLDGQDGLAAARHYHPAWPRIRAEFDCLPLADNCADMVIFNASLHYSTDYAASLLEARRVVRPGGFMVVLETPIYKDPSSGARMVEERAADFQARFGTRSDSLASRQYLTEALLAALARDLGHEWERITPNYGLRWALRPWIARLRGAREPARFEILVIGV